ncbi:exo-alpha-sialidase [Dyadobacter sp. Leaf189]|uniref:sialidase family protein n=1 Tax=Dyadobacter sp. Leaf189 TaxID=1736295 RepID=UPI0006F8ADA4|nr:sialidase family protein [Dyadobacter sp. Leaf189]KQS33011.1 neuraminidase [Dyadobacter sp. Leaf189]
MKKLLLTLNLTLFLCISAYAQESAFVKQMLIFPHQPQHVHGSSIVSLPNGDFLSTWFQGSGERTSDDVKIMGARLRKGENKWSEPFLLADTPNIPDCNPVLFLNAKGKLFLVWIAVQANLWEQSILRFKTSENYLKPGAPVWEWQDNILLKPDEKFAEEVEKKLKTLPHLTAGWAGYAPKYDDMIITASKDAPKRSIGWMTRIKPLLLENGKIILPLYSDGFNLSMTAISENNGETWRPGLPIVGRGPIQPAIIRKKNGDLLAFMRDSGDEPTRVHVSESTDQGESWQATRKTDIPNTASVELIVLKDGRWAFLGNDIENGRYILTLRTSADEGKTWKRFSIENDASRKGGYSYPSLIQTPDGLMHMTYSHHPEKGKKSIKYVVVDPTRLP